MTSPHNVAIVGATGLVGQTILKILEERSFPVGDLLLLASDRSSKRRLPFGGRDLAVQELRPEALSGIDLAFFATEAALSRELAPQVVAGGAYAIDNSSAFRLDSAVALVVPEVNRRRLPRHPAIVANPNCSTIQLVVALQPLHERYGIERLVISTYQAVSGAGVQGLMQFEAESRKKRPAAPTFPHTISNNCLPSIGSFDEEGHSTEEMKIVQETRKILELPSLPVAVTAVRVPVANSHSEAVWVQMTEEPEIESVRQTLSAAPGVVVIDDPETHAYPLAANVSGRDEVFVGRVRRDPSTRRAYWLWVVADNLRKGAATNAVQIAEALAGRSR